MFKRLIALLVRVGSLAVLAAPLVGCGQQVAPAPGQKTADFTLPDPAHDGRPVSLADLKDSKVVVVVFVGTECPISNAYMPRLAELHREFAGRGVAFLAVNANSQDTPARVAAHAARHELPFPVLKDAGNAVADLFGAARTPEAFVLDGERVVRYRGRIDDQYGVGFARPGPTRRDLAVALEEVLSGRVVTTAATEAPGCRIARLVKPKQEARVTYAGEVSRILQDRCQECHRPGQIGPFSLLSYDDAVSWSDTIREVVQEGRMPPWLADPKHGHFANDRRLSGPEKEALLAWIDGGCPKGSDGDGPPPKEFAGGWRIDRPDLVLSMGEECEVPAAAPATGVPYQYFWVDPHFAEDRWVVQAEARAGAPSVVHHILVFIEVPGTKFNPKRPTAPVLCGVAPGDTALVLPAGVAKRVPKGSHLVFQMHYTPDGKPRRDRSSVGLVFAKGPPEREALTLGVSNPHLLIPPGADNHLVESSFTFPEPGQVLGFMPHMHLRGKDFTYEALRPDGQTEVLLSVPRYNFGWQGSYRLAQPYPMPKGGTLHCVAHFDNSANNPNNPDPTKEVRWGDQTWEEMMIGWTEIVFDRKPR
jgi:peroxiredoxin